MKAVWKKNFIEKQKGFLHVAQIYSFIWLKSQVLHKGGEKIQNFLSVCSYEATWKYSYSICVCWQQTWILGEELFINFGNRKE